MVFFSIAFLLGDLYLQTAAHLPEKHWIYLLTGMCSCLYVCIRPRFFFLFCIYGFILGWCWTAWYAQRVLSWTLPESAEGVPVFVTGYITSLPRKGHWQTSFIFLCEMLQWEDKKLIGKTQLSLSCRDCPTPLKVGDRWQLLVKLKHIHSTSNPGSFDYEAFSIQQGVRAAGHIITSRHNRLLSHHIRYPLNQIRQLLQHKLEAIIPSSPQAPWLLALTIGEKQGINQNDWDILRKTGTNHLMAIAGLHIGIVSGFAHFLTMRFWRWVPALMLYLPAQLAGACAALVVAILYSALAGFSIPTQRACLMLAVFIVALLFRRKINSWHAWSLALMIVLILNPLSVLTESFWLSFGTLALIIYGMSGRLSPHGLWWKWGRVQWVIGIGLIPLTLFFFQECSLISFAANTVAIPWLGFLILPFCFISALIVAISPQLAACALWIANKSLAGLWMMLAWFAHLKLSALHLVVPHSFLLVMAIISSILLLLPTGLPGRWLGIIWLLPLFYYQPTLPKHGEAWMMILDVGQGLSVVIQTQHHTLVYDAGPKLGDANDMGESVVVPYLRTRSIKHLDMLVVSHGDNDHSGGANAILTAIPATIVKTSTPDKLKHLLSSIPQPLNNISYCLAGQSWRWDGVNFTFLYPTENYLTLGNDSSCVLRIDNGFHSILLTGDIEKFAEKILLNHFSNRLYSTILLAPHHGSKTSAYLPFVQAVNPQFVIYATGYRNRYHFPHPSVVRVYDNLHTQQLNTAVSGAITFTITNESSLPAPELYRVSHQRYWQNDVSS